jgi:methionyl-tRNA formyltransferase
MLCTEGYEVVLVVTRPPKRRGRGGALTPSPVEVAARELGCRVTYDMSDVLGERADLGLVVAYGRIIPDPVVAAFPLVNVHYSLLPNYRGAAPMERAILNGDEISGVSLMAITSGLDEGEVYDREEVPLRGRYLSEVSEILTLAGLSMVRRNLKGGREWLLQGVPQAEGATYAPKLRPEELRVDWSRSAEEVLSLVRLERAYCLYEDRRLKIERAEVIAGRRWRGNLVCGEVFQEDHDRWVVACGGGSAIELVTVRPEGRRSQSFREFLRSLRRDAVVLS